MASDLTTTITESVTLNGAVRGTTNELTITGINEILEQVVNVQTTEATVILFGSAQAAGQLVIADTKYVRLTNLDATNFVQLRIATTSGGEFVYKLQAGETFILHKVDNSADVDSSAIATPSMEDIVSVKCQASTAACDVEIFAASA